jgi:excisionase family DNA binding protein
MAEEGVMKGADYLLVREVAVILGVAPNTVRAWSQTGKLREYRHPVNNYRLFKKSEVEALRERIENPAPQPAIPRNHERKPR